jgi:hypothetical protein
LHVANFIVLTDYNANLELREKLSLGILANFGLYVSVNLLLLLGQSCAMTYRKIRLRYLRQQWELESR